MRTIDLMQRMRPHGDSGIPGLIEGIAAAAATVFPKYGLSGLLPNARRPRVEVSEYRLAGAKPAIS